MGASRERQGQLWAPALRARLAAEPQGRQSTGRSCLQQVAFRAGAWAGSQLQASQAAGMAPSKEGTQQGSNGEIQSLASLPVRSRQQSLQRLLDIELDQVFGAGLLLEGWTLRGAHTLGLASPR